MNIERKVLMAAPLPPKPAFKRAFLDFEHRRSPGEFRLAALGRLG